jgi:FdhE protein
MERLADTPLAMEAWARRRRRAQQLLERHTFAAQVLSLYHALLDVQEAAFLSAVEVRPSATDLPRYVADHVMHAVADVTGTAGPPQLSALVQARRQAGDGAAVVARWLAGERQGPADEYFARAATEPVLEALGSEAGSACRRFTSHDGCPRCGAPPQVSYFAEGGEALVSGPRLLQCCRCGGSWIYPRMTCVACGEPATGKLPIFADAERFPHLRADACETCHRYVITVDLRKDPEAVPIVDELIALPLDLYAQERGFAKLMPNLMAIG